MGELCGAGWPGGGTAAAGGVRHRGARLSRFAAIRGIPPGREFLLDYDVIEAFCVTGLPGCASSTRGTYRSALYRLAEGGRRPAGAAADAVCGREGACAVLAGGAAELAAVAAAQRDPVNGPRRWPWWCSVSARGCSRRAGAAARHRRHPARPPGRGLCQWAGGAGGAGHRGLRSPGMGAGPPRGQRFRVPPRPGRPRLQELRQQLPRGLAADPAAPRLSLRRARSSFICGHLAAGTPVPVLLAVTGIAEAGSLARYARHVSGISSSKGALRARCRGGPARERRRPTLPPVGGGASDATVAFAAELIDRSGKAPVIEAALAHRTGRRRPLPVRAVLTALACLALDDRPLFLTEATRLLFCQLSPASAGCSASPAPSAASGPSGPPTAGSATAMAPSAR